MDDKRGLRETPFAICRKKNTWKNLQNTVLWCILKLAQQRGLLYQQGLMQLYSCGTLPAEFIEKAVCMKTGEQLHQRESERPRVALKANSHCESQDLPSQEARSSFETQGEVRSFRETGCNIVDYRIPGISLSTVQEQDERKPSWSRSLNPVSTRNNFFKIWARRWRSTGSAKHRKGCWKTRIKQKSSSSAPTLSSFSARTANLLQK